MICCFNHIVYVESFIFYADGIGLKNISGLFVGQTAPLNVVGVICQIDLCLMVNTAGIPGGFLIFQNIQQGDRLAFFLICTLRLLGIFGNIPGLSGKEGAVYPAMGAIVSDTAL